ncbi:MAG: hypothetical protein JO262_12855 [Solirubrobacterales bacterium]|nr:hypothetical protein [Solirubrobacterales bacterium]
MPAPEPLGGAPAPFGVAPEPLGFVPALALDWLSCPLGDPVLPGADPLPLKPLLPGWGLPVGAPELPFM